jgi:hypothetical protein
MQPTLVDGQGLIAVSSTSAKPGQIRCLEHPSQPGFWLVKRVGSVQDTTMRVVSDNLDVDAVDSRRFGPVPVAGTYRVIIKIPKRLM